MNKLQMEKQKRFNHLCDEMKGYITFLVVQEKICTDVASLSRELSQVISTSILTWNDKK